MNFNEILRHAKAPREKERSIALLETLLCFDGSSFASALNTAEATKSLWLSNCESSHFLFSAKDQPAALEGATSDDWRFYTHSIIALTRERESARAAAAASSLIVVGAAAAAAAAAAV